MESTLDWIPNKYLLTLLPISLLRHWLKLGLSMMTLVLWLWLLFSLRSATCMTNIGFVPYCRKVIISEPLEELWLKLIKKGNFYRMEHLL
uniref:Glutathione synthetaseic n=1 Tax=Rhizophora mucronata TaxID=61149 RepID=A0A2P2LUX7_RHIMU